MEWIWQKELCCLVPTTTKGKISCAFLFSRGFGSAPVETPGSPPFSPGLQKLLRLAQRRCIPGVLPPRKDGRGLLLPTLPKKLAGTNEPQRTWKGGQGGGATFGSHEGFLVLHEEDQQMLCQLWFSMRLGSLA